MTHPLSARTPGVLAQVGETRVHLADPVARFSLRARGDLAALDTALGLTLPRRIGRRADAVGRSALCLGPDEWVIHAPVDDAPAIVAACAGVYDALPHSLVDVSGREVSLVIEGPRAAELLTLGMPRDPESIAPGEGRRIKFDGVTVILWRDAPDRFRMDIWHSFAPHLLGLLDTGTREFAAEESVPAR